MTDRPLQEQRILILGAGGAGIGIARLLRHAMSDRGMNPNALSAAIAVVDSQGLIHAGRTLDDATKREVAWPVERLQAMNLSPNATKDLDALVKAFAPTVLIGTTGQAGIFSESIVRTMADAVDRPIILPLSNPTSRSEAVPADLLRWTDGRAVIATGSPFDPVVHGGRTHIIGQANNVYIFPGVGLGALVAEATQVTDGMFQRAAETVAARLSPQDLSNGLLFPPLTDLRSITAEIAAAVVREARASGVGGRLEDSQIESTVASRMWFPQYPHLIPE